jgi:Tol biopolymer transport system component
VWWDWSYDGTRLAIISTVDGIKKITIANTDGSGSRTLDVGMPADFVSWRGPDDSELVFRGYPVDTSQAGIFAVRPDGTGLRQVSKDLGDQVGGYQDPQTAQDGSRVAYTAFELDPASGVMLLRLHVLDLTTGLDIVIPGAPDPIDPTLPTDEGYGVFSADGRQIAFWRDSSDNKIVLAVAPSDGSSPGHSIGPANPKVDGKDPSFDFSPDASMLVVRYPNEAVVHLLPLDGRPGTTLPLNGLDVPSWQRRAP